MRFYNILQLGIKELRGLGRDTLMVILIIYAFSLSVYTASVALPETLNRAAISVVDEDRSALSQRILDAFYPPYFITPEIVTTAEMDARLDAGTSTFVLDIPVNFEKDVLAGRQPELQLNIDATRMTQAFTGNTYIQQIIDRTVAEYLNRSPGGSDIPVKLDIRARYNPQLSQMWFGSIINIITSITMLSMILSGAALIREREHGTIEHLLVMPVTAFEIMVSKIWSIGLVVLVAAALSLVIVVQGILKVPVNGSMALFLFGSALMLFAMCSLGIFLATVAGSMPQFGLLLMLVLLPLQVLSGGLTPRESMPQFIQDIMLLAPNTHYVTLSQAVLFRGAGLDVVWPQLVWLTAIGLALFAIALRRFRVFLQ
ncbi:UNVERIFIED_ORG: ABC-2 type transport system permease protein [Martelella mediterranea]